VATTDDKLISEVRLFVDQYNSLRDTLDEMTFYNEVDNTTGVLFGSAETLRIDNDLSRLLTGRFAAAGPIQSLEQLGISVGDDGKIELDETALAARFAADPDAVRELFAAEDTGVAARFWSTIETLAGEDSSLLINRSLALQAQVDVLTQRTDLLDARLAKQRERLLLDFYRMELAISEMQSNLSVLSALNLTAPTQYGGTNGET
jgi:flagellar hook-associated protein 2